MAHPMKPPCWKLTCPECGQQAAMIVNTGDLTTCVCEECDADIDPRDVPATSPEQAKSWDQFAGWLALAAKIAE